MFGGEPFGCLVGDYQFDNSPEDVALLGNMANVCAAAHTPVHRRRLARRSSTWRAGRS